LAASAADTASSALRRALSAISNIAFTLKVTPIKVTASTTKMTA
jgi:hypothetical protein